MDKKKKKVAAKGLDDAFNITYEESELPIKGSETDNLPIIDGETGKILDFPEVESDFDFIKRELRANVQMAKEALDRAIEIQKEDEKARNTEVIADMIDSINSCLKELGSINKIETELALKTNKETGEDHGGGDVTNNVLVVGNTSEILKQIADGMKKD
jgi:hypothetical protein